MKSNEIKLIVIAFVMAFSSCKKQNINSEASNASAKTITHESEGGDQKSTIVSAQELKVLGQKHNAGLASVYGKLSNLQNSAILNLRSLSKQYVLDYLQTLSVGSDFSLIANTYYNATSESTRSRTFVQLGSQYSVSPQMSAMLLDLDEVFNNSASNPITGLGQLEINAKLTLTDNKELSAFLSATTIATYSYNYWSVNQNGWITVLGNQGPMGISAKALAKADAAGALGGAMSWWAGLAGPISWGATVLGGACIASVCSAF